MAARKSAPMAPGACTNNNVRGTMDAPFNKAANARDGVTSKNGANYPPFDQAQSMGNGGVPTKFYDTAMGGRSTTPAPSQGAPSAQGPTRRGTK